MKSIVIGWTFLLLLSVSFAAFPTFSLQQAHQTDQPKYPPGPLEKQEDPYVSGRPDRFGPAGGNIWRRGPYVSIQVNVNAQGNNILGDAANEPSMAIDPTNPNRIVIGWRQFNTVTSNFRQAGWAYSHDGGLTWTFPGVLEPGVFRSDPVLEADADGNFYWASLQSSFLVDVFKSSDGGVTWPQKRPAFGGDKQWIVIDKTNSIGRGNIYQAWSTAAGCCGSRIFNRSTDGGLTFSDPITIPNSPIWGTLAVGPNGELYIVGRGASGPGFYLVRSTNAKDPNASPTFDFATSVNLGGSMPFGGGPNPGGLLGQVWVDVDTSNGPNHGNLYVLCSVNPPGSDPLDVHFVRSTNGGQTWSQPRRINDDPISTNAYQWFGTMAVAPNGRIDVIWNDTRNDPTVTFSELHYAYSLDGGLTWSVNIPVSPRFNHFLGYPNQNKIGDYYDMTSDNAAANIAYAATFNGEQDVYFLRVGDCNSNSIHDGIDIAEGRSRDDNRNAIPDECESPGDVDGDECVNNQDLSRVLSAFGRTGTNLAEDMNRDRIVNDLDAFVVLLNFGRGC